MSENPVFVDLKQACQITGLSTWYLRKGCKDGSIPHVKSGKKYLVCIPALLRKLGVPSDE